MADPKLPETVEASSLDELVSTVLSVPAGEVPDAEEQKQVS